MSSSQRSRRTVFRRIARHPHLEWPAYDSTPLYDRSSLAGLEADVRTVSEQWFRHDAHESVDEFVCSVPLTYFRFETQDRYASSTSYDMQTLFRLFLLKECYGWNHETAFIEYLSQHPDLYDRLDLESVPDQSTLWHSCHHRFTAELQDTVETAARTILIKAQNAGVTVPQKPDRQNRRHREESTESDPDDQTVLEQAEAVTEEVSRVAFPRSHWTWRGL